MRFVIDMEILKVEFLKFKRSSVIYPLLFLPLVSILYGSLNYYGNKEVLTNEWISLWTQVYLFYGSFFFPSLIGILCAYSWNNEYKSRGINLILTSKYSFSKIIFAKIIVVMTFMLLTQVYFLCLFYISGSSFNFNSNFTFDFIKWAFIIICFSIVYVVIEMYVFLKTKNFAITVIFSLLFGVMTFFAVSQQYFMEIGYLLASAKISLYMNNHFSEIYFSPYEMLKMVFYTISVCVLFVYLQIRQLEKNIR